MPQKMVSYSMRIVFTKILFTRWHPSEINMPHSPLCYVFNSVVMVCSVCGDLPSNESTYRIYHLNTFCNVQ